MKIIGIEGSSFSGKTTLANGLGQYLEVPVIEEYAVYAQPEGFPAFAINEEDLKHQIEYYTNLESRRAMDLQNTDASSDIVIVDRTAASLVAFQEVMSEDIAAGQDFLWNAGAMKKKLLEQKAAKLVIDPDITLVLTAGSQAEHDRRVQERGSIQTITNLNDWRFSEKIRLKTKESLRALGTVAVFDYINTGSMDDIIDEVEGLIEKVLISDKTAAR